MKKGIWQMIFAGMVAGCCAAPAEKFPDVTETPALIRISETRTVAYRRPAWHRFLLSLRPYSETTSNGVRARLDTKRLDITGSTSERTVLFVPAWMPTSYAIGLTGGLEY